MRGSVVQISVSRGGLPKYSIPEATVHRLGIEGDGHAHPHYHGGPRQALLLIMEESLDELGAAGYQLYPGAMGENITTRGLDRKQLRLGQRFRVNQVLIELTKIRVPCAALDVYGPEIKKDIYDPQVKAGDHTSPRWGLSGFYASVLQGGEIRTQDIIEFIDQAV
jgi:MOSC domain-containing protein YiiM